MTDTASAAASVYRCTPRSAYDLCMEILEAGLVPFLRSSPGVGKSSIARKIADALNIKLIDHRLSTSEPTDLSGLPDFKDGMARYAPFTELFPIETTPYPKDKQGWLIFLDEFNSANKSVQAASYKLILDHATGQHPLHPHALKILAGNLDTDRAITTPISTAMQSRVITMELEVNHAEWMEDVALAWNFDSRIVAYLNYKPAALMDFRPDHNEKTFCCPRTWEFMNKLIQDRQVTQSRLPIYAGTITSGVAVDFVEFCKVFKSLITMREVLADPDGCHIPNDQATRWATICHLLDHLEEKHFEKVGTYAARFPLDLRIIFFRGALQKKPKLRQHPAFIKVAQDTIRYLKAPTSVTAQAA